MPRGQPRGSHGHAGKVGIQCRQHSQDKAMRSRVQPDRPEMTDKAGRKPLTKEESSQIRRVYFHFRKLSCFSAVLSVPEFFLVRCSDDIFGVVWIKASGPGVSPVHPATKQIIVKFKNYVNKKM